MSSVRQAPKPCSAQEIAKNLRPEAENLPQAQVIAQNLRSEAENLPKAHEIAKNLRSEPEMKCAPFVGRVNN